MSPENNGKFAHVHRQYLSSCFIQFDSYYLHLFPSSQGDLGNVASYTATSRYSRAIQYTTTTNLSPRNISQVSKAGKKISGTKKMKFSILFFVIVGSITVQLMTTEAVPYYYEDEDIEPACMCSTEYQPVCGSDWVTYSNKCQFMCAQKNDPYLCLMMYSTCETQSSYSSGSKYSEY